MPPVGKLMPIAAEVKEWCWSCNLRLIPLVGAAMGFPIGKWPAVVWTTLFRG